MPSVALPSGSEPHGAESRGVGRRAQVASRGLPTLSIFRGQRKTLVWASVSQPARTGSGLGFSGFLVSLSPLLPILFCFNVSLPVILSVSPFLLSSLLWSLFSPPISGPASDSWPSEELTWVST